MPPVVRIGADSILTAASVVRSGGLIVYPTDTVYGLGCNPRDEVSVLRLVRAKRRQDRPIPVLCSSLQMATSLVEMNDLALRLATRHWPGALTIVGILRADLPRPLHRGTGTLGVRIPASSLCVRLIEACGGLLTGTSANISGMPSARAASDALEMLGESVDFILDGGRLNGRESTVVKVAGEGVQVLRAGPVGLTDEKETR